MWKGKGDQGFIMSQSSTENQGGGVCSRGKNWGVAVEERLKLDVWWVCVYSGMESFRGSKLCLKVGRRKIKSEEEEK